MLPVNGSLAIREFNATESRKLLAAGACTSTADLVPHPKGRVQKGKVIGLPCLGVGVRVLP